MRRKNPLAFLAAIALITVVAWLMGKTQFPKAPLSEPDFHSVLLKLDFLGSLKLAYWPAILSIMFTDLFDSLSTFVGLAQASNLVDKKGEPKALRQGLIVDAIATAFAALCGSSSGTAYIESAAGVEAGGRTGWVAVFLALLFLPCFFIAPLVKMVPAIATAPVLIIVGYLMFSSIRDLAAGAIEETFPAFLTAILIPLTFSITTGLMWGITSYIVMHVFSGKARRLSPGLYFVGALCVVLFFVQS
jgi:AGZA family xanthine/uracil permease-like MFS transporter